MLNINNYNIDINDIYCIINIIYFSLLLISYNHKLEKIFFENKSQKMKYRSFCLTGLTFIYIIIILYIIKTDYNAMYCFLLGIIILCFIINVCIELIIYKHFKAYLNIYDDLLQEYMLIYNEYPDNISNLIIKLSQKKEIKLIDEELKDFYYIYIPIIGNGKVTNFILKSDMLYVTLYSKNSLKDS